MENLLQYKEFWQVVDEGRIGEQKTATQQKNYDERKLKGNAMKHTTKQIRDAMKLKYQGNARVKQAQLQRLRRDFEMLEMKAGETVTDYLSRVMVISNDLRNAGEDMSDVKIIENVPRTMLESFNFVVCTIE